MKRISLFWALVLLVVSCKKEGKEISVGDWWGKMEVASHLDLPFTFTLSKNTDGRYVMQMYNAEEVITVDEIEIEGDSIHIQMPVFEGYFAGTFSAEEIHGSFIKESLERIVPFSAFYGKRERFQTQQDAAVNISGIWETYFDINTDTEYPAKGIFMQNGNKIKGTFRTRTGDYRYLDGVVTGDSLKLSAFDGSHVYLFMAKVTDSTLEGRFYDGNHSVKEFMGARNEAFELPDANSLTYLREGYDRLNFSFPDATGKMVSLSDTRFSGKPVLVQIMGSWCPNCLDETRFYVDFLKEHPDLNIELVALAFEYAKTEEKAFEGIRRLKERVGANYPILLAQFGTSNKQKANEKLPMLNHILSYPTTIYLDKKGAVRRIHTGFNGPATGKKYEEFKKQFTKTMQELASEPIETDV
ncbi:TlpA family protein disulfide reductase [Flagellimonas alvinocaridis]|uniref:TlpA family protein disulfide reductase n=1 Tax=Flagellimonas alvinocaridis TaxID=2530200 RepID=A0A4S8RMJ6_9FLAO|nr:TlpA disulfide reductase family protein [Allomuricauda alvinocaridis]THV59773.1 TlpA family protein disulfide reductase [Allomuricauda alvinocaridis]